MGRIIRDMQAATKDDNTSLRLSQDRDFHKITVTDIGIGIPQQMEEKIFEVFHRLHEAREYEGTGIGLSILKKIITTHGAAITATGKEGLGTTFNIYLPVSNSIE